MLVGDHVLGRGTSVVTHPEGDVVAYLESLRRVHDLGPSALYCGHGPELTEDPGAVLDFYLAHRAYREHQLLAALADGRGDRRRAGGHRLRRGAAAAVAGRGAVDPRDPGQAARRGPGRGGADGRPTGAAGVTDVPVVRGRGQRAGPAAGGGGAGRRRAARRATGCWSPPRPRRRCWPSCSARCAPASSPSSSTPGCRPAERAALAEDADPALDVGDDPARLLAGRRGRPRRRAAGPAHALHVGDDGPAQGRVVRASWPTTTPGRWPPRRSSSGASGRATGTSCSRRCTTARRCGSRSTPCSPAARCCCPGPFDAARAAAAISTLRPTTTFCVPTHLQRLLAPRRRRLVLVPPAGARRRAVPRTAEAGGARGAARAAASGSSTAPPRRSSPSARRRTGWRTRAASAGPGRAGGWRPTSAGQLWCAVPPWARFEYWRAPGEDGGGLARRPGHRRRPRPGGRRRHRSGSTGGARTWSSPAA